ncbi:MAG: TetR/AcrR family transcriptional regulator [Candidatus Methylacidiphilales bacterium]|nr:TetR/AcrR family transcriptional regulator [Candidatus Methylacidiphilales bacterium]
MKATPRPYHHGNLRESLLHTAEKALEVGGVPGLTFRELSRTLGVSHTSPLRHFANKQALLDALALRGFERLSAILSRAVKDRGQNFNARLMKLARAYVGFQTRHPALCQLMFEAKHRADAPRDLMEASERAFSHGPAIFAEGQANGEVTDGDPARLSLVAFAALQGLISISTNGKFKGLPLNLLVSEIIERIIQGFRP